MTFYSALNDKIRENSDFILNDPTQNQFDNFIESKKETIQIYFETLLRTKIDPEFRKKKKAFREQIGRFEEYTFGISPIDYPVGFCGQITLRGFALFEKSQLFIEFKEKGIILKKVFGKINDKYFENAIQIGNYYLCIANNALNPKLPPVTIKKIEESGFKNIEKIKDTLPIMKAYWNVEIITNPIAELSFRHPFLMVRNNWCKLCPNFERLFLNDCLSDFQDSENFLFQKDFFRQLNPQEKNTLKAEVHYYLDASDEDTNILHLKEKRKKLLQLRQQMGKDFFDEQTYKNTLCPRQQ
ncbi:MAG: hypothetical protein H6500_01305 [Candidatus Woesearchaeota archaeon]|nr:hypothetical protein [Nanoarchaeota archaeon]USN44467.1 MAG: hypothetical protein H6500_01305 [Candidatus Woesearchaeota archaeon]